MQRRGTVGSKATLVRTAERHSNTEEKDIFLMSQMLRLLPQSYLHHLSG